MRLPLLSALALISLATSADAAGPLRSRVQARRAPQPAAHAYPTAAIPAAVPTARPIALPSASFVSFTDPPVALPAPPVRAFALPPPESADFPDRLPEGAVEYRPATWTQSIYVLFDGGRDHTRIDPTGVRWVDRKWHQSGGTQDIAGVVSRKFKTLPAGEHVVHRLDHIRVTNSLGATQPNLGIVRRYPDGTRFDDVLSYAGRVFEHRVREKAGGRWESSVIFRDEAARPPGYAGLRQACASCHDEAGTGGYAAGLVPGGDTVLSDPLDWTLVRREWRTEADIR